MKRISFGLLILLLSLQAIAQKEANVWYFGSFAGVDFNSGSPVALTNGALTTGEGCATICDKNGTILFYTDGIKVWNRNHLQMPNGLGLLGDPSSAESAIAVPKPGDRNRYYLFTVAAQGNPGGFCYSEIDMTLDGGLGDIVTATKNTQLFSPSVEKITATKHANGLYTWVIAHGYNNNRYYAYLVTCSGINTPVTTNIGQTEGYPGWGYLMTSPNGKKLATAMRTVGFELLDFDNATGIVSNPILLSNPGEAYGVGFSPDNSILYGLQINTGNIFQWNLQAGSSTAIIASLNIVGTAKGAPNPPNTEYKGGAIQLGPDKKLYIPQWRMPYLSVINNPNTLGTGCNLQTEAVDLLGRNAQLGLPGLIQSYFDSPKVITHTNHCIGSQTAFSININAGYIDSVRWDFGDPTTGALNTATTISSTHQFSAAGNFTVRFVKYLACVSDTTFASVTIDSLPVVDLGGDIVICADSILLQSSGSYTTPAYTWSTGEVSTTIYVKQSGTYWLQVTQNTCVGSDTINVDIQKTVIVDLGQDKVICSPDVLTINAAQPAATQYLWSTGLISDHIDVTQSGKYWVYVKLNGCEGSDTINVTVQQPPVIDAGRDTIICESMPVEIGAFVAYASYKWSNDSTTPYIHVAATGDYILTVTVGACVVKDTVSITAMPNPKVNLGSDTDICLKELVVLNAGNEGNSYLWSRGGTTVTDTVTDTGTYWVTVTSEYHCIGSDTIHFRHYPLPQIILGNDTTVCQETPLQLKPVYSINEDALLWSDGSTGRQISVGQSGMYYVHATNKCGTVGDTINIREIFCDIRIPNAFTPNGDGVNDILKALGSIEHVEGFELSLYNRWGERMFITNDKHSGWDGTYKGQPCATAVYVYVLQYNLNNQPVFLKGNVTLIR